MKKGHMTIIALVAIAILLILPLAFSGKPEKIRAPKPECNDKIDNDGDGNIDRADSGCSSPQDTDETDCGDGVCEAGQGLSQAQSEAFRDRSRY